MTRPRLRWIGALLALLWLIPAAAGAQTAQERAQLEWVLERGRLLFELDRAAWVGTDDMLERIPDARSLPMRGYIVEPVEGGYAVTFYGGPETAPVAFYRGQIENRRVVGRQVFAAGERPPLTPLQRRLAEARDAAGRLDRRPCSGTSFNTVVVPPAELDAPADLYLLTPQLERGVFPFGGHFRATVAPDGTVAASRAFTNSCIALPVDETDRSGALVITHLLDPVPTEIHVFLAIWTGVTIFVGTDEPERLWVVTAETIEEASPESGPSIALAVQPGAVIRHRRGEG